MDRLVFVVYVATIAAACGDPFVEFLGNLGVFGVGYHDSSRLGVIPALSLGVMLAIGMTLRRVFASSKPGRRDEAIAFARTAATRNGARSFATIVALELLAVYAIEAFESLVGGPGAAHSGPVGWLGAPIVIALAIHVALSWLTMHVARGVAASSLAALSRLVAALERFIVASFRAASPQPIFGMQRVAALHALSQYTWRTHGLRAPPSFVLACR